MNDNIMETYIRSLIKNEIGNQIKMLEVTLKEEDASKIILSIIPQLDELISKRVKQHFKEFAELIIKKFEDWEIQ